MLRSEREVFERCKCMGVFPGVLGVVCPRCYGCILKGSGVMGVLGRF